MAAKPKQKSVLVNMIGKRVTLTDFDGKELNPEFTLILRSFDDNWLETENMASNKTGFFNISAVAFITAHKEQG